MNVYCRGIIAKLLREEFFEVALNSIIFPFCSKNGIQQIAKSAELFLRI